MKITLAVFSALLALAECEFDREIACGLPPVTGPCRAFYRMYYYESHEGICKPLTYGGCGGNDNQFRTMDECMDACAQSGATPYAITERRMNNKPTTSRVISSNPDCMLPSTDETKRCQTEHVDVDDIEVKYVFNPTTGRCQNFMFCGTERASYIYDTSADCVKACSIQPTTTAPTTTTFINAKNELPATIDDGSKLQRLLLAREVTTTTERVMSALSSFQKRPSCLCNYPYYDGYSVPLEECARLCKSTTCQTFTYNDGTCYLQNNCLWDPIFGININLGFGCDTYRRVA